MAEFVHGGLPGFHMWDQNPQVKNAGRLDIPRQDVFYIILSGTCRSENILSVKYQPEFQTFHQQNYLILNISHKNLKPEF